MFEKLNRLKLKENTMKSLSRADRRRTENDDIKKMIQKAKDSILKDSSIDPKEVKKNKKNKNKEIVSNTDTDNNSDSDSDSGDDEEDNTHTHTHTNKTSEDRLSYAFSGPNSVKPHTLKGVIKTKNTKKDKIELARAGKMDRETYQSKLKGVKHSIPESVKKRNKPMAMMRQKSSIKGKRRTDVASKLKSLRTHVKNSRIDRGGKQKRRRG
eukprot:GHVR01091811.1.p1 GENE.GHVR01091811.1~~GHVR01091811.1.p1  ORF type:complete len:211 (+),score=83.14 GHVR01091811.1:511-1143(+)